MIQKIAETGDEGMRIDRFLRQNFPEESLSALFAVVRKKKVRINGKRAKASDHLCSGDKVDIYENLKEASADKPTNQKTDFNKKAKGNSFYFKKNFHVLHKEGGLIVLDKPSGVASQPGTNCRQGESMAEMLHHYCGQELKSRHKASLVHRLDRETSGILLSCDSPLLLKELSEAMREHRIRKHYIALVQGTLPSLQGSIDQPLLRTEGRREKKIMVSPKGQAAKTDWKVLGTGSNMSLVELRLHTGRMHQIRVHMAYLGCPLAGDRRYGNFDFNAEMKKSFGLRRLFLHSAHTELPEHLKHYKGQNIFESALPKELKSVVEQSIHLLS